MDGPVRSTYTRPLSLILWTSSIPVGLPVPRLKRVALIRRHLARPVRPDRSFVCLSACPSVPHQVRLDRLIPRTPPPPRLRFVRLARRSIEQPNRRLSEVGLALASAVGSSFLTEASDRPSRRCPSILATPSPSTRPPTRPLEPRDCLPPKTHPSTLPPQQDLTEQTPPARPGPQRPCFRCSHDSFNLAYFAAARLLTTNQFSHGSLLLSRLVSPPPPLQGTHPKPSILTCTPSTTLGGNSHQLYTSCPTLDNALANQQDSKPVLVSRPVV